MRIPLHAALACVCVSLFLISCGLAGESNDSKITFDLDRINEEGLVGPPAGLRSVMYEFCIPADSLLAEEVRSIDRSVSLYPRSRGRIGCSEEQILCIGSTQQPEWRGVLERLAALDFVARIDESFME